MSADLLCFSGPLSEALTIPQVRGALFSRSTSSDRRIRDTTNDIIASVASDGDMALRSMAFEFDKVSLASIEVPVETVMGAVHQLPSALVAALERAARNIRTVHESALPRAHEVETEPGVVVGRRPDPLDRVGVYAPGGRAAYPSSVLMGAIPARCAGVPEVILCSPPGPNGVPSDVVLAAAAIAGVDRVFAVGGAGAIAAMALGTETVPKVRRIVGPGNAYVAEAKLQLSGYVSIDSPAGPSELLVVADASASPEVICHELLAQAEHDPLAAVVGVFTDSGVASAVEALLRERLPHEPRTDIIRESLLRRGALITCDSIGDAVNFATRYAPEHLMVVTENAEKIAGAIRNAGTVFIGEFSSVAFGDYLTGANHVLPTGMLARSYSGLSTLDFVRWTTYQRVTREGAAALAADAALMADAEHLPAHAAAARFRAGDNS